MGKYPPLDGEILLPRRCQAARRRKLALCSCATRIYLSTLHRRKWWVKGVKPNVPIIRNRYTILDIAPPAGSWALALSSALDTHQSLLTYTPRPAPRGAARGSLSLNFITRVAPHCVNSLSYVVLLHAGLSIGIRLVGNDSRLVVTRPRHPEDGRQAVAPVRTLPEIAAG